VAVDPDQLEALLQQLTAGFGIARVFPEPAEVLQDCTGAVDVRRRAGAQRGQLGVATDALPAP
jgi:hypothetical protein